MFRKKKKIKDLYKIVVIGSDNVVHKLEPMSFKKANKEYNKIKKFHELVYIKKVVIDNEKLFEN